MAQDGSPQDDSPQLAITPPAAHHEMCHLTRPRRSDACQQVRFFSSRRSAQFQRVQAKKNLLVYVVCLHLPSIPSIQYRASLLYSRARLSLQSHQGSSLFEIHIVGFPPRAARVKLKIRYKINLETHYYFGGHEEGGATDTYTNTYIHTYIH